MRRIVSGLVFASVFALGACDVIRVPGGFDGEEAKTSPPASTPDSSSTPAVIEPEPQVTEPTVTPVAAQPTEEAQTPSVAVVEAETTETETEPSTLATDTPDATEASVEPDEAAISDLAAINALNCGLPVRPLDSSMTLAQVTGALPANEETFGFEAVNAFSASLEDFPGLVKMEPKEYRAGGNVASGHCGATRIAEKWFITAAHCLDDDYDDVVLITGSEDISDPDAIKIKARSSLCHGAYGGRSNNFVNDIALVRIEDEDVANITHVPIANYGATDETLVPFNYPISEMAGWGLTSFGGSLSNQLLTTDLTMTGNGPAAIGVQSVNGAGPCIGDSGGPLFVTEEDGRRVVVGVLSVVEQNLEDGKFCEGTYGARYTNLQGYQGWISSIMRVCDTNSELCGF